MYLKQKEEKSSLIMYILLCLSNCIFLIIIDSVILASGGFEADDNLISIKQIEPMEVSANSEPEILLTANR